MVVVVVVVVVNVVGRQVAAHARTLELRFTCLLSCGSVSKGSSVAAADICARGWAGAEVGSSTRAARAGTCLFLQCLGHCPARCQVLCLFHGSDPRIDSLPLANEWSSSPPSCW